MTFDETKKYNTQAAIAAIKLNPNLAGETSPEEQGEKNAQAVELMKLRLAELKAAALLKEGKMEASNERKLEPLKGKFR